MIIKMKLYISPFEFLDIDKLVTKSIDQFFQQFTDISNDCKSLKSLCLTVFEVKQTSYPFT